MKKKLYLGILFICLFALWTASLVFIDREAIGPNSSVVGYATVNKWFYGLTGVNWNLYHITDWGAIVPIILGFSLGILGLIQWIKRKLISKVDKELIILGIFYLVVFLVYLSFEFIVINRRPVLINGYLEASYPSSTTFLSITFMLSFIVPIKKYIISPRLRFALITLSYIYMVFLVIGRLLSGVHWITDIIGAVFISIGLLEIYEYYACKKEKWNGAL